MQAIANAKSYAWSDWMIGIMRSFLSGGAAAMATGGGGALAGITPKQQIIMMLTGFVTMGLYRLGEFLQLHGAPDKVAASLAAAADANGKAGAAIAEAKNQATPPSKE
jgi:hypothetical protein